MNTSAILDNNLEQEEIIFQHRYAGFWQRLIANIIDHLILGLVQFIFSAIIFAIIAGLGFISLESGQSFERITLIVISSLFLFSLGYLILWWVYYAYLESTYGATIGKDIIGLKVTDMEGNPISFSKASGRFIGRLLSLSMTFYLGYIMAVFTNKKQALHDMIAGCLVLKNYPTDEG